MFSAEGRELVRVFGAHGVERQGWNRLHFSLGHSGDEFSAPAARTTTSSPPWGGLVERARVTRGSRVFLPVLLELFLFALPPPSFFPSVSTLSLLSICPIFRGGWGVVGGSKVDDPSRRCPPARPRHQREIDGQRIQTRSARLRPACLLFEGGCSEGMRGRGNMGGGFVEFT